jgi:hypothetical protein
MLVKRLETSRSGLTFVIPGQADPIDLSRFEDLWDLSALCIGLFRDALGFDRPRQMKSRSFLAKSFVQRARSTPGCQKLWNHSF